MKCRKTTFILAVASALCATSATASIKEECKQMQIWGEMHISDWFKQTKRDLELDFISSDSFVQLNIKMLEECLERHGGSKATDNQRKKCVNETYKATKAQLAPPKTVPSFTRLVDKMKDFSIIYTAFCKD